MNIELFYLYIFLYRLQNSYSRAQALISIALFQANNSYMIQLVAVSGLAPRHHLGHGQVMSLGKPSIPIVFLINLHISKRKNMWGLFSKSSSDSAHTLVAVVHWAATAHPAS